MQCPHCLCEFEAKPHVFALGQDQDGTWEVTSTRCPTCDRLIVNFCNKDGCVYPGRPALSMRARLSDDVPPDLAGEYHTAAQVIPYSPEASAAIGRRLLHRFLADHVGVGSGSLAKQIDAATTRRELPPYLNDALDTMARVARLHEDRAKSAHPEALAPVQRGEPEWLLDVLDQLFDLYFVQPARMQRRRARLEEQVGPLVPMPGPDSATLRQSETSEASEETGRSEDTDSADEMGLSEAEEASSEVSGQETVAPEAPQQTDTDTAPSEELQDDPASSDAPAESDRPGWRRLTGR